MNTREPGTDEYCRQNHCGLNQYPETPLFLFVEPCTSHVPHWPRKYKKIQEKNIRTSLHGFSVTAW